MPKKKFHTFVYLITKKVVRMIIENEDISELDAIQAFYQSEVYQLLEIEETKYWWLSPEILYEEYALNKGGTFMSKESDFFILLVETYANYRDLKGSEILQLFKEKNLVSYIYDMYEQYHIETLQNAFDDLDKQLELPTKRNQRTN